MRQILRDLGADPDAVLTVAPDADADTARFATYERIVALLAQVARERPLLLYVDDIHWADRPSLELLSYLTPTLGTRPLLVVAAYRDLPADRTDALADTLATVSREESAFELALAGMGPDDIAALAVHVMTNTALTGATYDIDGGQQLL